MPIVTGNVHLDVKATGYLASHVGWKEPALSVIVAISRPESDGNSGTYRPESQNPAGGRDIGLVEINDKAWPKNDPFTRFHPITNLADALMIWQISAFTPWGYPSKRNDDTLGVAAIRAELGVTPYSIDRSPYYLLKDNGIDTMNLPVPPAGLYVSRLPNRVLRYGDMFPNPGPEGDDLNSLQRILDEMGRWARPGQYDRSYFTTVAGTQAVPFGGISSIQRDLKTLGYWTGATDGKVFDAPLRTAWDNLMRAERMGLVI